MIFDAHGDILTDIFIELEKGNIDPFTTRHLELYKRGGVTHSIFVNFTHPKIQDKTIFDAIFDRSISYIHQKSDIFTVCLDAQDLLLSDSNGTIGVILGMEGIKNIRGVSHLQDLYDKGVRHASLTWNEVNRYGAGLDDPNTTGITDEGIIILREMQRLGMIVDLAHSNELLFNDILDNTTGPIIISHGNIKAICDHKRNYTDQQLLRIKERDGVIGLCGIAPFLSHNVKTQTVTQMAKHIDYAVKLIGIDHVGLGFDFCYYLFDNVENNHVEGLQTIGEIGNLFDELRNLGYNETEINKIKFDNFYRVIKQVLQ